MFSIQLDLMEQSNNGIRTLVSRVQLIKFGQGGGGVRKYPKNADIKPRQWQIPK